MGSEPTTQQAADGSKVTSEVSPSKTSRMCLLDEARLKRISKGVVRGTGPFP